jgi:SnoaL-like domain
MDTTIYKQFESWLEQYKNAWESRNPGAVDELFAEDAVYCETPFVGKLTGIDAIRRYWEEGARDSQMNIKFSYDIIALKGNRGFAKWYAEFDRVGNRVHVQLDGILETIFNKEGKVEIFNEWWHRKEMRP